MSNISQFGGGGIKSIQRGVATPGTTHNSSTTVTISAVDTSKSICFASVQSGEYSNFSGYISSATASCALTSSTQLTIKQGNGDGPSGVSKNGSVSWTVVEYY